MSSLHATFIGTATTLLEVAGVRLLTDPVFDPPGRSYGAVPGPLGAAMRYRRLEGPALPASAVGKLDAVLLSHDHHGDNLDEAGRQLLPGAGAVLTTPSGARRLARRGVGGAVGLAPGARHSVGPLTITAAPARHGPPGAAWLAGEVTGFFVEWPHGSLYVSGDTVWHGELADFARSRAPDLALVHVGAARFGLTRRFRYTADAGDVARLAEAWPRTVIAPVHYEGWTHFSEGRAALERRLVAAGLTERVLWLEPGHRTEVRS